VYCGNHHQASRRINAGVVVGVRAGTRDRELHARTGRKPSPDHLARRVIRGLDSTRDLVMAGRCLNVIGYYDGPFGGREGIEG
jgi:hypothetical protein